MDRFSKLPDFIMHHIMSYLSEKEVAQTSILSKRWKGLRESFPIFDLHDSYIHIMGRDWLFRNIKRYLKRVPKFIDFVDASLSRFSDLNLRMQKFRLMICVAADVQLLSPVIENWIRSAIECGVEELDLDLFSTDEEDIYTLPQILFSSKSINTIKLCCCKLEQPSNNITRLLSLKRLTLIAVCIQEETIQKLIGQCPLLEDFSLEECRGFNRFYVAEAYKLKTIKIRTLLEYELRTIRIVAPTLQEFNFNYQLRQPVITIDMSGCPNLKELRLSTVTFTYQEFHSLISNFPLLEVLDLEICELERITISSNILLSLSINHCYKLKAIDIDTPNLVSFIYKLNQIPEFSINAPCPWYVEFENSTPGLEIKFDLDTRWFLKMKEFLEESNQIEFLTLKIWSAENSFSFDKFIQSSASLPYKVGTLYLQIDEPQSNYEAMLDGVFAICNPRILYVLKWGINNNFIEWLYEKLKNKDSNCCKSYLVKCWRHYLKGFKIERFFPDISRFPPYRHSKCQESFDNIDNLKDVWSKLQLQSGYLQIRLDWCFSFNN